MRFHFKNRDGKHLATAGVPSPGGDVEVLVASPQECEEASYVVCVLKGHEPPQHSRTNVELICSGGCGRTLSFRPYCPVAPPKICVECFLKQNHVEA